MSILNKLYPWDSISVYKDILEKYFKQNYLTVSYLYFANFASEKLYDDSTKSEYIDALNQSDFLLPDWIALQTYYKKKLWKSLSNLNWTDFLNLFLDRLVEDWYNLNISLFWWKQEVVDKAGEYIKNKYWIDVVYKQNGYSEFDFDAYDKTVNWLEKDDKTINLFLIWISTPIQEKWMIKNKSFIEKYKLITMCQWWTFEFWWWFEKRAPKFIRAIKLERFWRLLTKPKKNFKKVYYSLFLLKLLLKK